MSVIDVLALFSILTMSYIGYTSAVSFNFRFILNFLLISLAFYLSFLPVVKLLKAVQVPDSLVPSIASGSVVIPSIFITNLLVKILLKKFPPSKIPFFEAVPIASRVFGGLLGFVGAYFFVTSVIVLNTKISNKACCKNRVPEVVSSSLLYKINTFHEKKKVKKKVNNMPALGFLVSDKNIEKYKLSKDSLANVLKIINGISNEVTKIIINERDLGKTDTELFRILFLSYSVEYNQIKEKYKISYSELQRLKSKITTPSQGEILTYLP